ncbi:MAG: hypothetical protein QNJ41_26780 [Xenococcaceae cyanobacterium MO_188.B32]|nr:hypothetical protein [Xenococcaceae cyanobacterium MO_188.B32]
MTTFNSDELELLAAGYVLDDLDEAEMALVPLRGSQKSEVRSIDG